MPYSKKGLRLDLRTLILVLSAVTAVVMLLTSFFASYRVQRQLLIDNTLETNHVYSAKLSSSTESFLSSTLQQLSYSAKLQAQLFFTPELMLQETERLQQQTNSFNSTFVVDKDGIVRATCPSRLNMIGAKLETKGVQQALTERRALISDPYISAANNLVVVLSQPIFNTEGEYLGFVGGSIYLREHNILNQLLGQHYYKDGSYIYVVDHNKRMLYHPDTKRIGTIVETNEFLNLRSDGILDGTHRLVNSYGIDMLAGFSTVPSTGWVIVSQRPLEKTIGPLKYLMLKTLSISAPLIFIGSLLIWWLALTIARPLWLLAASAREMAEPKTAERINDVQSWYFEATELKRALLFGLKLLNERIGKLKHDVQTDPLTELNNRRSLTSTLEYWEAEKQNFSAIALDIDHFKTVNDTHGHETGDNVIMKVSELMRNCSRENDILYRTGGEEFLILLPGITLESAVIVAERLRNNVQFTEIPPVGSITISLGVAHWSIDSNEEPLSALSRADQKLYTAKKTGRNKVAF